MTLIRQSHTSRVFRVVVALVSVTLLVLAQRSALAQDASSYPIIDDFETSFPSATPLTISASSGGTVSETLTSGGFFGSTLTVSATTPTTTGPNVQVLLNDPNLSFLEGIYDTGTAEGTVKLEYSDFVSAGDTFDLTDGGTYGGLLFSGVFVTPSPSGNNVEVRITLKDTTTGNNLVYDGNLNAEFIYIPFDAFTGSADTTAIDVICIEFFAQGGGTTTGIDVTSFKVDKILAVAAPTVTKTASILDVNNNGLADIGEQIEYEFLVENLPNGLSDLTITDSLDANEFTTDLDVNAPPINNVDNQLASGTLEISYPTTPPATPFTITVTLTVEDTPDSHIENSVTVTADNLDATISDTASVLTGSGTFFRKDDTIRIDNDSDGLADIDDVIRYTFTVQTTSSYEIQNFIDDFPSDLTVIGLSSPDVTASSFFDIIPGTILSANDSVQLSNRINVPANTTFTLFVDARLDTISDPINLPNLSNQANVQIDPGSTPFSLRSDDPGTDDPEDPTETEISDANDDRGEEDEDEQETPTVTREPAVTVTVTRETVTPVATDITPMGTEVVDADEPDIDGDTPNVGGGVPPVEVTSSLTPEALTRTRQPSLTPTPEPGFAPTLTPTPEPVVETGCGFVAYEIQDARWQQQFRRQRRPSSFIPVNGADLEVLECPEPPTGIICFPATENLLALAESDIENVQLIDIDGGALQVFEAPGIVVDNEVCVNFDTVAAGAACGDGCSLAPIIEQSGGFIAGNPAFIGIPITIIVGLLLWLLIVLLVRRRREEIDTDQLDSEVEGGA